MKKMPPFDPREVFSRAVVLHQAGKFNEAEQLYKKLVEVLPDLEPLQSTLGAALASQNKNTEALSVLQKALKLNSRSVDALTNIGAVYVQMGQVAKAEETYQQLIDLYPTNATAYYNLGNIWRETKREEAIKLFQKAIQLDNKMHQAYQNLAVLYQQTERHQEAMELFKQIAAIKRDGGDSMSNIGYAELEQGNLEKALAVFQDVVKKNPENVRANAGIARVLIEQGMNEEALASLERAIQLNPAEASNYVLQGNALMALNRGKDAITAWKEALKLEPKHTEAASNLNRAYMRQIPAWHFTMLADEKRNDAYDQAIRKAVNPSSRVLDIGTGSGLLAMMAARAGAEKVTACELVKPLAEAATDIIKANGYDKVINVINKKSNTLEVGKDLDKKVNVIVSEILDAGLLGEGVIPSLRHALSTLADQDVKVIPQSARVYAALIEIPERRRVSPINQISGFNLSEFNRFRMATEYTTVVLSSTPYQILSEPVPVYDVDFRKLPAPIQDNNPQYKIIPVKADKEGTVQAVACWFELQLDDEICVSTKPGGEMVHWGQAVCFLEKDIAVKPGDELRFKMTYSDSLIWLSLD